MRDSQFDVEAVFDTTDYLYFYRPALTPERTEREIDLLWRLLDIRPEMTVLYLAYGHGRIANGLAERGCLVTGHDVTPAFLEQARHNAAASEVKVEYVEGDMRLLPWTEHFDYIINWFTAYGYFPDDDNRKVLSEACRALKLGGKLLIELNNRERILKNHQHVTIVERDGNYMLDRMRYDLLTGGTTFSVSLSEMDRSGRCIFLFASSPILNSPHGFSRQVFGRSIAMIKMVRPST